MQEQNKFGAVSKEYRLARRGYPVELYVHLRNLTPDPSPKVLDLGCGTGISTRELQREGFHVIGIDKEESMLQIARQDSHDIEFIQSSVEKMPFPDGSFDMLTAFNAYHWFNTDDATNEIRRVLKPGGVFVASLKNEIEIEGSAAVRAEYKALFTKYVGGRYSPTTDYYPAATLKRNGFTHIQELEFPIKAEYTVDEALSLIQSYSCWNLVPIGQQLDMLGEFKEFFERRLNGIVVHATPVETVVGFKK